MFTDFESAMIFLNGFMELVLNLAKILLPCEPKGILDILIEGALILFESQRIVSLLLDDLGSNRSLRSHGINRHDTSCQHELVLHGPRAHQMESLFPLGCILGTS